MRALQTLEKLRPRDTLSMSILRRPVRRAVEGVECLSTQSKPIF
jgi:ribosomal protein L34E